MKGRLWISLDYSKEDSLSAINKEAPFGAFLFIEDSEDLIRTPGSTNSPGANLHERSEPSGGGAWMRRIQNCREQFCTSEVSPQGVGQDARSNPDRIKKDTGSLHAL